MGWTFLFMFVALKVPLVFLLWLVWYAARDLPEPLVEEDGDDSGGGGTGHAPPRRPRPPRRGAHGGPRPSAPKRVRPPKRRPRRVRS